MSNRKLMLFLILLVCMPMMSTDIFVPVLPKITQFYRTNVATISFILSFYMIGYAFSVLLSGILSDLYGRKRVLQYALWIYCISSFLIVICHNFYLLVVLRFFQGLGGGSGTVIGRLIVKDHFDAQKQVDILITLSLWMAISPGLSPQLGVLITKFFNWHMIFFVTFLLGAYILYLAHFFLMETKNTTKPSSNPLMKFPHSFVQVFMNRKFMGYTLLISFTWCLYFTFISLSSFTFQRRFNFSEHEYATLIGFVTACYLLSSLLAKYLNKRNVDVNKIILYGVILCSAPMLIFSLAWYYKIPSMMILAIFLIRAGIAFLMPTAQAVAMHVSSNVNIGWNMGCLFFIEFILGSLFVYFAGIFEDIDLGLGMVMIMIFSSIMLWVGLCKTKEP